MISNMGPRPAPLLGTTEQKADEFVRRVDFAMAQFAEPVIVNGLLRRHVLAMWRVWDGSHKPLCWNTWLRRALVS